MPKLYSIIALSILTGTSTVFADVNVRPSINLSVSRTSVGDSVAYSPNLEYGGFITPTKKPRFNETAARFAWQKNAMTINAGIAERQFTSLRDNFAFSKSEIGVRYRLNQKLIKNTHVWVNFSSNRSHVLLKNSFTTLGDQVIKSVTVARPADRQLQLGIERTSKLNNRTVINILGIIGNTDSTHAGIKGNLTRRDCDYTFEFSNSGGNVEQVNQCGNVTALSRTYPSDATVDQEFGVSPAVDFRNRSTFGRIGAGFSRTHNAWLFSANYYYQRYYRGQLDKRINADGARVHSHNHVLSGKADYRLSNGLTLSATAEYQRHAYLDEIPVLYTKLTSDRFNNSAVFFTVNINYRVSL